MKFPLAVSYMCCALSVAASATIYTVEPGGGGDFPTIQTAIDYAQDGDIIELANGTFTGEGNRNIGFLGKAITVCSASMDPAACVIDCQQLSRGVVFGFAESQDSILEAVTIANGYTESGTYGGGIACTNGASPTIRYNIIRDCYAEDDGGGISLRYNCHATIIGNLIAGNVANDLGGGSAIGGGGIQCSHGSDALIADNVIVHNYSPGLAGGIGSYNSSLTLESNTVALNISDEGGAGVAAVAGSHVDIGSCIIWGNGGPTAGIYVSGADVFASCSNIQDGWPGEDNIDLDPLFCDPGLDDYQIAAESPCAPFSDPNPDCDLIGALPVGCGIVPVRSASWGAMKSMYRR